MFDVFTICSDFLKRFTKKDLIIILIIVLTFFSTRLYNLDGFPIFNDEGIYIQWAKTAKIDATQRFISLTDGKQPLQTWGTIPFLKFFPDNALLAGRLYGVTMGFLALIGVFAVLLLLFNKKSAYIGSLFYLFTPYYLFYDRMALSDSGVNAGGIWIFFFSILLARTLRLDIALMFGLVAGMGLLTKSSEQLYLAMAVFAPLLFVKKLDKETTHKILNFYLLLSISFFLAFAIYNVQRLSPYMHYIGEKNTTFVMSMSEFRASPFANVINNIFTIPLYVAWELAFVVFFFGIGGLALQIKKNWRLGIYWTLWIFIIFAVVDVVAKVTFPRYFIFLASLIMLSASYFVGQFKNKKIVISLLVIYLLSTAYFVYTILFDFKNIPFHSIDRGQYIVGWPAGWGAREIVEFGREKSKDKPVIILAEGDFGMAGDVLNVFIKRNDRIQIKGFWPLDESVLKQHQQDLEKNNIYIVFSHRIEFPDNWPMKLIKKYTKPENESALYLYELLKK
ncbi:MAG: glycosyltransferase family 39 protein [Candidatus Roizmanbacteria bacterium]